MAKITLLAIDDSDIKKVDTSKLCSYEADVAYDIWSLGVVLFHIKMGRALFINDENDDLSCSDVRRVSDWNIGKLHNVFYDAAPSSSSNQETAYDLIKKLLETDPKKRLQHCQTAKGELGMIRVLEHDFFQARKLEDATLEMIKRQNEETHLGSLVVVIVVARYRAGGGAVKSIN